MGFINLHRNPLRGTLPLIRQIKKRDIILCYYHPQEENMVSEDIYWIEKNVGNVRYLGVFGD